MPALKRNYTFPEAKEATGRGRNWWYHYEKLGFFELRRIGARTYVPAEVIDGVLDGTIKIIVGERARAANAAYAEAKARGEEPRKGRKPGPRQSPNQTANAGK
jgi:hypothetical protein